MFALAAIGFLSIIPPACAGDVARGYAAQQPMSAAIDVERIRNVLQLTQEQERYWRPVEAALRELARHQAAVRIGWSRAPRQPAPGAIVLDSAAVQRLAVAARPLIAKLDDEQKQAASESHRKWAWGRWCWRR